MDGSKQCTKCHVPKPLAEFALDSSKRDGRKSACRECTSGADQAYRQADPERRRVQVREAMDRYRQSGARIRPPSRLSPEDAARFREAEAARVAADREQLRAVVFSHYGRVCACPGCGATENLTIDHVEGGGTAHRAEVSRGASGTHFYRWLVSSGFPPGFQVLCLLCNSSKGERGGCRLDHAWQALKARITELEAAVAPEASVDRDQIRAGVLAELREQLGPKVDAVIAERDRLAAENRELRDWVAELEARPRWPGSFEGVMAAFDGIPPLIRAVPPAHVILPALLPALPGLALDACQYQ